MGARIRAYDPAGMQQARSLLQDVEYAEDAYHCAQDAHALVIVTEWEAFRALDFPRLKRVMERPVFVDLRNIYRRSEIERNGFVYEGVGRP
jgi:UDPglucose 6-dehydrogenase